MRIFYVTLNTAEEAGRIARLLLERKVAVCCNWFPITCAYRWEGRIVEEAETVLLVKTQPGRRAAIEQAVAEVVSFTNCIAELAPESVNAPFRAWLDAEVPVTPESDLPRS
ncbi:Periplasmic divalent cation tolerance protein cutA [Rhodovastum atsumiense]|uniref:Divalent-cation tolerance protein CutA n=1 Tax=Rhodovastum atsumiense TaxID=504468 RepID=A0A5M6IZR2_9PROT|nr:divalent-cation tolerance protein CutA [Rhodovastum atsumiense]KAA5613830.1 divalent-cation tolerance protein CutA [Rhodovastum atsumiense]CAH2601938.1 Periplasmic divalent cation tolerance protein cutA [Rhodovastum atsumiense]